MEAVPAAESPSFVQGMEAVSIFTILLSSSAMITRNIVLLLYKVCFEGGKGGLLRSRQAGFCAASAGSVRRMRVPSPGSESSVSL